MSDTRTQSGLDLAGLICAYRFSGGNLGLAISPDEAAAHAAAPAPGAFLWLHFNLSNVAAERWMRRHLQLPDDFLQVLKDDPSLAGVTRLELTDDGLLVVINDVRFDFDFDPSDVSTLRLFVGPHLVVSARSKALRSIDQLRTAVRSGARFSRPGELLAHLLQDQAEVMQGIIRALSRRVDQVEDGMLTQKLLNRAAVGEVRRVLVRLQRVLAPEPAALFRLLNRPPAWLSEAELVDLRQAAEEFAVVIGDSSSLAERAKLIQEEISAYVNEQNNRSLYTLTWVTVLALPFNIVGALLGMNVGGIPWGESPHGFWIIVALVAVFAAIAGKWLRRHS